MNASAPVEAAATAARFWTIGRFRLDLATRSLSAGPGADGIALSENLSVKTAAVLQRLAERAGEVVPRERLIAEVWEGNSYTGSRALTQAIWQLRRVLDTEAAAGGESAIKTISKAGYQLLLPAAPWIPAAGVAHADEPADAPAVSVNPAAPWGRRRWHRAALWGLVPVLMVVLASSLGLAGLWWPHSVPVLAAAALPAPPLPLTMRDGVEEYPAFSADGRWMAYLWSRAGSPARLQVVDRHAPDAPPVEIRDEGYTLARPMWLGARRLAYARAREAADCEVVVVDVTQPERPARRLASCFYERNQAFVDASPDGQWLVLARHQGEAGVALVLHRVADGQERQLTRPAGGLDDAQISFSRRGDRVAFMRGTAIVGDLYVVDIQTGAETRLTHDQAPVGGLAWLSGDAGIVFNSARDGAFATWRVAPAGGEPTLFARAGTATNLATLPGEPQAVAASLHHFSDTIELRSLADGRLLSAIASSGRNLYAQACPDAGRVLFLSMRSGRIALWTGDGQGAAARQVALPPGTPDPPGCSATEPRFATSLRAPGAQHDALVIGRLDRDEPLQVLPQTGGYNSVSWSLDGRSLLVASGRGGGWDLWRFDLQRHDFQRLTDDQGHFGREVRTRSGLWLYYARLGKPGLWRRPLDQVGRTGAPTLVTDALGSEDWANWQWHDGALWLVERGPEQDQVVRRDELGAAPRIAFTLPPGQLRLYRSFAITPQGEVVASMSGPRQADIVRLEGPALPAVSGQATSVGR
ncbi:winged helix-turn-helix domain-containing protein [Ideonella azotifigens]|uniref:winged helix-turn-helix domain-containing protein n=2 Tax=Ideonella azotifigens TaxID=513160 RepID=UPI001E455EAC|nr:winged helix-turn-helix domain-containing protein [Ideonella azotifigens]MCD2343239.1 winged helix-turn-helix domain-containing protein [Ideonella azotifigens]